MAKNSKPVAAASLGAAAVAGAVAGAALNAAALFKVVEASRSGGVAYLSQSEGEGLFNAGFITINTAQPDPNDASKVAAYPTEAGAKFYDENNDTSGAAAGSEGDGAKAGGFEIDDNVPLAEKRRGSIGQKRESIYPFDKLGVGQSFHVPVSADMPKPNRTLGSAVSNATKSYAVEDLDANGAKQYDTVNVPVRDASGAVLKNPDNSDQTRAEQRVKMKNTRVFTVRAVGADDPRGEGARVYRTA